MKRATLDSEIQGPRPRPLLSSVGEWLTRLDALEVHTQKKEKKVNLLIRAF